jgi:hypothetical protein
VGLYLERVRKIAEEDHNWSKLGPVVAGYRKVIENEIEADTRKLEPFEAFQRAADGDEVTRGQRMEP